MTDDLDSSSRGIWVFPYENTEAGPSKPRERPLKDFYTSSLQAYRDAYEVYEDERGESQLDDLTDWLNLSLESKSQFHRLPVAILQTKKVHGQIKSILGDKSEVVGVQGRDILDIGTGVRAIASSLVGELLSKSGFTGLDQVEGWYKARKGSPTIILHIQDAQVISPQVLGESIYIICLHPNIPFRLLLSVPFTSTFLSTWQLLEPSSIDLTILRGGRRGNALNSMLETKSAKISVGDELAGVLKKDEEMFGTGPEGTLKAIQMLHHSVDSPLATLVQSDNPRLAEIEAILAADDDSLGKDLFRLSSSADLVHVTDPSPRISILHALGNTSSFTSHLRPTPAANANARNQSSPSTPKKRKSRHPEPTEDTESESQKGDLEHLEVLYNLWKGAGKQVNLWDWLQGYKNHITGQDGDEDDDDVEVDGDTERKKEGEGKKRKRQLDDVDEDGIHASFVRFCEEARMLGMVRARGKGVGRKADEVVKGVTLL